MFSYWHHIALALSVSVSQMLTGPPAAFGQTTSRDTTAGAPTDTLAVAPSDSLAATDDSVPAPGDTRSVPPTDTVDTIPRPNSDSVPPAGGADTATTQDSVPAAATRDSASRPAAAAPAAPVDSILSAACGGPEGSATIARDLLVLVFAPEAGPAERAAAANSVNGRLTGSGEPGVYYVRLPSGMGEAGLRAATDNLSRHPQVRQVGTRACPALPDTNG